MSAGTPLMRYVRTSSPAALQLSSPVRGVKVWLRTHLFLGPASTVATIVCAIAIAWLVVGLFRYAVLDAVWSISSPAACRVAENGACWAFIWSKLDYFRYGAYPVDQRWRVDAAWLFGAVLIGRIGWRGLHADSPGAAISVAGIPIAAMFAAPGPFGLAARLWPDAAILLAAIGFAAALVFLRAGIRTLALLFFVVYPIGAFLLLRGGWIVGLPIVDTNFWGGLLVTLVVSIVGIVASVPGGVLLALGRRSSLPVVSFFSTAFIEVVRGVPLVMVLFIANTMMPLFVPERFTPDRLVRPLVGVAVFAAVYMAEVVRGGLQAIPKGQYEAARALGLGWPRMMRLVILPQALALVVPGIVNSCIALFMDTTLVAAVGIFDFLNTVDAARIDPNWAGPTISTTAYVFAALVYWAVCFGMSRYAQATERRVGAGRRTGQGKA
jgi:general L-amino acid transport system permease protein